MDENIINEPKDTEYIEPEQSANTLFKFMKKMDYLKEIIKNCAIIPRYNDEIINYLKITLIGDRIAFPMICFCDINLTKLKLHAKKYGDYGIGIKKEWAYKNVDIEPIHYVNPNSNEVIDFRDAFFEALSNSNKDSEKVSNYLSTSLLYMKPIFGKMDNGEKTDFYCFHDEREWRYIPHIDEKNIDLILRDKYLTDAYKMISNETLRLNEKYWLKFSPEDINYIIVENEKEAIKLAEYIYTLEDRYTRNQILGMISKILILNNLGKDW